MEKQPQQQYRDTYRARINDEGRMVIPSEVRKKLGLQPGGQDVLLRLNDEGVQVTTFEKALNLFQNEVIQLVGPNRSLSGELLADRRSEVENDQ